MGIKKIAKINSGSVRKSDNHSCHLEGSKGCFFVPVLNHVLTIGQALVSIKTKKLEATDRMSEQNSLANSVVEISAIYNCELLRSNVLFKNH
jgi:hypothetical protein